MTSPLLDQLIEALRCLPGVGQKSAQRMAYHLLERNRDGGGRLAHALAQVGHSAVSVKSRHCSQWPMRTTASASTFASRAPPSRLRSSRW